MCGPLITASAKGIGAVTSYHLGRLLTYLTLGVLAGSLGEKLLNASVQSTLQILAAATLGLTFTVLGLHVWRGRQLHLLPSRYLTRLLPQILSSAQLGHLTKSAAVGLLSGLLPCGWLHSFVLAAVTTRNPWIGAALMGVFWIGTLPALTLAPLLFLKAIRPITRFAPRISGALLILAGLGFLGVRIAPKIHEIQSRTRIAPQLQSSPVDESCPFHSDRKKST